MRINIIILTIALLSILIGTVGFDYFVAFNQERELENLIISCMEQHGHYSDELVSCLNKEI